MINTKAGIGLLGAAAAAIAIAAYAQAPRSPTPPATSPGVRVETIARGLEHPWGRAFMPDGRLLVTQRPRRGRGGAFSGRYVGWPRVGAARRRAGSVRARAGRFARCRARSEFCEEPLDLSFLRRAGRRRCGNGRGAREVRRKPSGRCTGDLSPAREGVE